MSLLPLNFYARRHVKFTHRKIPLVCIATVCDWLKNLAPLSQQIRSLVLQLASYSHAIFSRAWHSPCIFLKI